MAARVPAPGVREQFGRTKAAIGRLVRAHTGLLRAELGDIFAELRVLGVQGGILLGIAILVANMLYIGGFLFLGEWLFGSIGWGLAHGTFLGVALITALLLLMLGAPARPIVLGFGIAFLIALLLGALLVSNVLRLVTEPLAASLNLGISGVDVPALLTAAVGAVILGLVLMLLGARAAGAKGLVAGLVGGLLIGALVGLIIGIRWQLPPAIALAITVMLVLWSVLQFALAWPSLDIKARFGRLYPRKTIQTTKETRAWLEAEWEKRRNRLRKKSSTPAGP